MLQVCADCLSRHEKGSVPPRPSSANRPAGAPIASPTDIRARRHVDELGRVLGHRKLESRDVAIVARIAVRVGSDHGFDIDQREIRIAEQQSSRPGCRRRAGADTDQHDGQKSRSHGVALSVEYVEANNLCAGSASWRLPVTLYSGCGSPIKYRPDLLWRQSKS